MTALRFALGVTACILLPAAIAGAVAGLLYDRLVAPRHTLRIESVADLEAMWLNPQETWT